MPNKIILNVLPDHEGDPITTTKVAKAVDRPTREVSDELKALADNGYIEKSATKSGALKWRLAENSDLMNDTGIVSGGSPSKRAKSRVSKDGELWCEGHGENIPETRFPTRRDKDGVYRRVSGECRRCRDARYAANKRGKARKR